MRGKIFPISRKVVEMPAVTEADERALSVRGAAAAYRVNPRLIRRRLRGGAFPGARRSPDGAWSIPAADIGGAGFPPIEVTSSTEVVRANAGEPGGVLVLEASADDAPVTRLCVNLVGAAIVQTERMRAELDKWHTVAEERARALERADVALHTVARAVAVTATVTQRAVEAGPARSGRIVPSTLPPIPPPPVIAPWDRRPLRPPGVVDFRAKVREEARRSSEAVRASRATRLAEPA